MNTALVYCQRLLFSMLFPNVFLKFKDNFRLPAPFGQKTTRIKGEAWGDCGQCPQPDRFAGGRPVAAAEPLRGRAFRCLFLHHQTAGRRRASRLAFVIDERAHAGPVGAHLCVRPWTEAAGVQRADTSVGPYRGSKGVLCFDGVAYVDCVQRAGHAPPLQRYQTIPAHKKGASHGAPACLLT